MQQEEGIHGTLTALAVAVGRLEEQMKAMRGDLLHHTTNEHKSFDAALEAVDEIKTDVKRLQTLVDQSHGAWWALAKLAAIIFAVIGAGAAIVSIISANGRS